MFKVSARTLLHLGAELISSDAVAFYELIKNAFDANSKSVKIEIVSRVEHEELETLRGLIGDERKVDAERNQAHRNGTDAVARKEALDALRSQLTLDPDGYERVCRRDAAQRGSHSGGGDVGVMCQLIPQTNPPYEPVRS